MRSKLANPLTEIREAPRAGEAKARHYAEDLPTLQYDSASAISIPILRLGLQCEMMSIQCRQPSVD